MVALRSSSSSTMPRLERFSSPHFSPGHLCEQHMPGMSCSLQADTSILVLHRAGHHSCLENRRQVGSARVDQPCRGAYTEPVTGRDSILAAVLAVAVTFAGTACACAVPSMDPGPANPHHHAHHIGDSGDADAGADHCVHADCQGDCGIDATAAERDAGAQVPKSPFDDGVLVAAIPVAVLPARLPSCHSPPPRPWRDADTPVRRFDILLN